ncbi:hypothetical protein, partial [Peribacillus frigoritolerans]|uniref:hypothetical protein n=1 Tax=Peribacillus frigoritolerans TaxID=450367 RepID=UPI00215ACEBE
QLNIEKRPQLKKYSFFIVYLTGLCAFLLAFFGILIPLFLRNSLWTILLTIIGSIYIVLFAPYHSLEETNIIDVSINAIVEIVMNIMFVHYFKKIYN